MGTKDQVAGEKKAPIVVNAESIDVKSAAPAPAPAQQEASNEGQEESVDQTEDVGPTALKEKPKTNVDLLDEDLFDDLEVAGEDAELVSASDLLESDDLDIESGSANETDEVLDSDDVSMDDPDSDIGVMTIFQIKCLRCTHLIPELSDDTNPKGKEFKNCHHSKGNEECPAKYATIVVGIPIDKIVKEILESEASGNSERLGAIYARLASKDEPQQNEVHRRLALARRAQKQEAAAAAAE